MVLHGKWVYYYEKKEVSMWTGKRKKRKKIPTSGSD